VAVRTARTVVIALALALIGPAAPAAAGTDAVQNQLVVGFRGNPSADDQRAIVDRAGGTVRRRLRAIRAVTVRPRSGVSIDSDASAVMTRNVRGDCSL
jgi:hypothetical protein